MTAAPKKQARKTSPSRRALYGKAHIAKKQLGLSDEEYRAILHSRFGVTSSTKLRDEQIVQLVEYFKEMGFKPQKKKTPAHMADHDEAKKMRALWLSLYHLGVVSDVSETALNRYAQRVTGGKSKGGKARLQWVKGQDAFKVIEALKSMAVREASVNWDAYRLPLDGSIQAPRKRVIEAQLWLLTRREHWSILRDQVIAALMPIGGDYVGSKFDYNDRDLDSVIEGLGALVRTVRSPVE